MPYDVPGTCIVLPATHEPFPAPPDPDGRPVDITAMGEFIGAAYDKCMPCQKVIAVTIVNTSPDTVARFVEVACMMIADKLGGVPPAMTDPRADSITPVPFRELARRGADGGNATMYAYAHTMTVPDRLEALDAAADFIAFHLG